MGEDSRIQVSNLTRNVKLEHLQEIFGHYGKVNSVEIHAASQSLNHHNFNTNKNENWKREATIVFESEKEAEQAMFYLDGGKIDGSIVKVSFILVSRKDKNFSDMSTKRSILNSEDAKETPLMTRKIIEETVNSVIEPVRSHPEHNRRKDSDAFAKERGNYDRRGNVDQLRNNQRIERPQAREFDRKEIGRFERRDGSAKYTGSRPIGSTSLYIEQQNGPDARNFNGRNAPVIADDRRRDREYNGNNRESSHYASKSNHETVRSQVLDKRKRDDDRSRPVPSEPLFNRSTPPNARSRPRDETDRDSSKRPKSATIIRSQSRSPRRDARQPIHSTNDRSQPYSNSNRSRDYPPPVSNFRQDNFRRNNRVSRSKSPTRRGGDENIRRRFDSRDRTERPNLKDAGGDRRGSHPPLARGRARNVSPSHSRRSYSRSSRSSSYSSRRRRRSSPRRKRSVTSSSRSSSVSSRSSYSRSSSDRSHARGRAKGSKERTSRSNSEGSHKVLEDKDQDDYQEKTKKEDEGEKADEVEET